MNKEQFGEIKELIEEIRCNMDHTHNQTADCVEVMSKAIKHIGRRLEILEEHIYNDRDEDYLN
jgi:hypothetical protein